MEQHLLLALTVIILALFFMSVSMGPFLLNQHLRSYRIRLQKQLLSKKNHGLPMTGHFRLTTSDEKCTLSLYPDKLVITGNHTQSIDMSDISEIYCHVKGYVIELPYLVVTLHNGQSLIFEPLELINKSVKFVTYYSTCT